MPRRVLLHGFDPRIRDIEVEEPATPLAILRALGIRRDLVLVFEDGTPVPDDEPLEPGSEVRVVRIVTGGGADRAGDAGRAPPLARLELTATEADRLLTVVRGRLAELERALQNVEEGEGMDATKWNARRMLLPEIEAFTDLALKLEGAAKEARAAGRT